MPYIGRSTDGFGVRNRFLYLASADDTSVSGADANGATLTFTDGAYVDVYLNGVLLKAGTDYNTNTANTIAGLSALASNDEVTVIVYDVFTVGDMVSATSGGTFVGNVAMSGTLGVTGATTTAAITASGVIKTDDTTDSTSTTTGSIQTDGGLGVAKDVVIGDDLFLKSDSAVLNFGADNDINITHVADTGLTTNGDFSVGDDLKLTSDSAVLGFGADNDITITHVADKGLILTSGSSGATADVNVDELVVQGSGRTGISILTPDANDGQLVFGSPSDNLGAFISYKHATAAMTVGTSLANGILLITTGDGSEKAKFTSTGFLKVRGSSTSYDGGTSSYHEFLTNESSTTGTVIQARNSSYTGRLSQFDCANSDSTTNAKFMACYSSNPGGSADLEFYARVDGQIYADQNFNSGGADYAEFFEWKDGNTSDENRVGCSVVLDGNQIRKATSSDNTSTIIGVISVNPSVVGDADGESWQGTYLKDDFGKYIFKDSEQVEWTDKEGVEYSYQKDYIPSDVTVPSDAKKTPIKVRTLNPDYDKSKTYERREDRKEWSYVGMMGKLRMLKGQPTGDRWIKMRDISDTVEEWLVR